MLNYDNMHSEISNEYNFDYELDITQNKRDKTEHFFSKEGFAIEDFMSINKTKSEKDNRNNSELQRREDSTLQNNFMDYLTDNTAKSRKNTSFAEPLPLPPPLASATNFTSPKFADSSLPNPKKEFTLRRGENTDDRNNSRSHIPIVPISLAPVQKQPSFKRKSNSHEQQYLQIEKQIRFLQDSVEKMVYESRRLEEDTQNLMSSFSSADYDRQMEHLGQEIRKINGDIEEQRNLEAQLTRMLAQLNEEHEGVTAALRSNMFPRPALVKDEAKAIIDDINILRAEFEALERDDGSLNLSSTLFQHNPSISASPRQPQDNLQIKTRLQEISEENRRSEDPQFLRNLKYACLKDQWNLFANRQILVQVSYRQFPFIRLHVGNKSIYDLDKFSLKEEGKVKMQGQCVAARSYLVHQIESTRQLSEKLFLKCEIAYAIQGSSRSVVLFIPAGLTNFGEFAPVTEKEFAMDAGKEAFECVGAYRPLDRQLLSQLEEMNFIWPNMLVDKEGQVARGLHISGWGDYVLVELKQRGELLSVGLRTPNWPLLRLLEFLLSS